MTAIVMCMYVCRKHLEGYFDEQIVVLYVKVRPIYAIEG